MAIIQDFPKQVKKIGAFFLFFFKQKKETAAQRRMLGEIPHFWADYPVFLWSFCLFCPIQEHPAQVSPVYTGGRGLRRRGHPSCPVRRARHISLYARPPF
ncbi:MAG: hypothetical protein ACI3WR_08150 [Oscillospiraceae bacterium]